MQINQIFIHAYRLSQMSIIRNMHWLKNSVQLLESPQCFLDLPNLVAFKPFILEKVQPKSTNNLVIWNMVIVVNFVQQANYSCIVCCLVYMYSFCLWDLVVS